MNIEKQRKLIDKFYQQYKSDLAEGYPLANETAVVEFQQAEFGRDSIHASTQYNNWLYNLSDKNYRCCFSKDKKVLGQQGSIAFSLNTPEKLIDGAFAIDLRVNNDWKMKGLGVALIGSLINRFELLIGLGISDDAYPMFKRQGWLDLGTVNFYLMPLNFKAFSSPDDKSNESLFLKIRNTIALFCSHFLSLINRIFSKTAALVQIETWNISDVEMLTEVQQNNGTRIQYSTDDLNWRFNNGPFAKQYLKYQVQINQKMVGWVVLKQGQWKHKKVMAISEILVKPTLYKQLILAINQMSQKLKCDAIIFQGLNDEFERTMYKLGYYKRPYADRFMIYGSSEILSSFAKTKLHWKIHFAASDMDFCITQLNEK